MSSVSVSTWTYAHRNLDEPHRPDGSPILRPCVEVSPTASDSLMVVFDYEPSDRRRLARASARFAGANSALPDTFGLKASALAELLNQRRSEAVIKHDRSAPR